MGRRKIKEEDKAVKKSMTYQPDLYRELVTRTGGRKVSTLVNSTLQWHFEVMDSVGISLNGRFLFEEVKMLMLFVDRLKVEPGQIGRLEQKFRDLLKRKDIDENGMLEREDIETINENFDFPLRELQKKLSNLTPFETLWLYERLVQVNSSGWSGDETRLKSLFRCR